jgi:hypothetical protein
MWGMYILLFPLLQKSWIPQPFILPAEVYKVSLLDNQEFSPKIHGSFASLLFRTSSGGQSGSYNAQLN